MPMIGKHGAARPSGARCRYCAQPKMLLPCKAGVHDDMFKKDTPAVVCPNCDMVKFK